MEENEEVKIDSQTENMKKIQRKENNAFLKITEKDLFYESSVEENNDDEDRVKIEEEYSQTKNLKAKEKKIRKSKNQEKYRKKNKLKIQEYNTEYRKNHQEEIQKYRHENKKEHKAYSQKYYQAKQEYIKNKAKKYYQENKADRQERARKYYYQNKDEILIYQQQYRENKKNI